MWLQFLINAVSLGSFYALVALGFSLIFGVTHAFNLAHGELILAAGYLAYVLGESLSLSFFQALPFCVSALLLAGALLHTLIRRVREPLELNSLVMTFGIALILQHVMFGLFSADYRLIPPPGPPLFFEAAGVIVTRTQVLLVVLSMAATSAVYLLLHKTFLGKALRATIQQQEAARLAGIQVERMGFIAFCLGGMLIGLAGPLFGQTTYLHPAGGMEATLIAIIVTIFAGVGRMRGVLPAAWMLGLVESFAVWALGVSWREMVSAVILIALLLVKPRGLLAQKGAFE